MKKILHNPERFSDEAIAAIEKATAGKIGTYEWWVVREKDGTIKTHHKPSPDADIVHEAKLEFSFMSQGGEYIGGYDRAQWYALHGLKVYEPFPHGVAEKVDDQGNTEGYVGYTHRGACTFKIGDKLFDENYEPKEEDYTPEQWQGWVKEYNDGIAESEAKGDQWWADDIRKDGISRFIPYKLRGAKTIENWEDAIQAAINMSNYLG